MTEECHEVTDFADDRHLMGDDDDGNTRDVTDAAQQRQNLRSGLGVEGTRGLITQKDARVVSQGSGNTHALALTTGKLGRIGVPASGQADEFQQFIDAGATLVRGDARQLERVANIVGGCARVEKVRSLENHADVAARGPQL